jgi:hypothetical protein
VPGAPRSSHAQFAKCVDTPPLPSRRLELRSPTSVAVFVDGWWAVGVLGSDCSRDERCSPRMNPLPSPHTSERPNSHRSSAPSEHARPWPPRDKAALGREQVGRHTAVSLMGCGRSPRRSPPALGASRCHRAIAVNFESRGSSSPAPLARRADWSRRKRCRRQLPTSDLRPDTSLDRSAESRAHRLSVTVDWLRSPRAADWLPRGFAFRRTPTRCAAGDEVSTRYVHRSRHEFASRRNGCPPEGCPSWALAA